MGHRQLIKASPIIALLGACIFLAGIASAAVTPYRGLVAIDGLGMDNAAYAIVLALASIGAAIGSVILGYASDKVSDRRRLVIICAALGAVAYGLIWLVPSQLAYIVAVCAILPFGAALFSQSFAYARAFLNQHADTRRAEFMIAVLRSLFTAAWIVAPPLVGWIASTYSMFDVFLVAAVAQLLCMLMFALLLLRPEAKVGIHSATRQATAAPGSPFPPYRMLGTAGVAVLRIALVVNLTVFPLVLINDIGASLAQLGLAAGLAAALEVPFMLMWGFAATRWPKEPIIIVSGVIFAAYLVGMFFARSFEDVLLLQSLNALGTAALLSITISYVQDAIAGRVGLSTSLIDVMGVIAGFATAGLFAILSGPGNYANILLAAAAASLLGAALLAVSWQIRRRVGA
ncbi:MAG: MFS transporter [Hyphomicrobiales bacterium]|nr:MAG: MFS transporter [Hyphomicrobiales bacterium]